MNDEWTVSIVIPARDETATIGACIRSVVEAAQVAGAPFDITVVADRCADATAEAAARALGPWGQVVEADLGSVGACRRLGTASSLAAHAGIVRPERTWLLATDADSQVPANWVSAHLRLAEAGAEGVAGLIVVDSFADHPTGVEAAFAVRYLVETTGEHAHVHGTNLGVRADAYLRAGGWREIETGEDHDLWQRLRSSGAVLVSTIEAPVGTSGRAQGRAPDGFAALLRSLATEEIS